MKPLVHMSGIGLLLLSTSARLTHLENQLKETAVQSDELSLKMFADFSHRAQWFRRAVRSLYVSLGVLSGGVLIGAAIYPFTSLAAPLVLIFTTLSHVFVVIAVFALHRASDCSLDIFGAPTPPQASRSREATVVGTGKHGT